MPQFYVYVLHCESKLADHAHHYCGATGDLLRRLREHATGRGANITQAYLAAGIAWRVASVFVLNHKGQFLAEQRVKRMHNTPVFCGICNPDGVRCIRGATLVEVEELGIPLTSAELAAGVPDSTDEEIPY